METININQTEVINRFIQYAKIDSQSNPANKTTPSTKKQWDMLHLLKSQLDQMDIESTLDHHGYLFATLHSNLEDDNSYTIGFLSHVDTATDYNASNVAPQIHEHYSGEKLQLNQSTTLDPEEFPYLKTLNDVTLITTSGDTLLSADNKAGVTAIMELIKYLVEHPEVPHGTLKFGFTPDEEIGRGPHHFDVEAFNADYAYTIDGGILGELQYESFNAASAVVEVKGRNIHPGAAKNQMINAMSILAKYHSNLPNEEVPELTEGYEGFIHLLQMTGDVQSAKAEYIIRDHDKELFNEKKQLMMQKVERLNKIHNKELVSIRIEDQYKNMGDVINQHPKLIEVAKSSMKTIGINPIVEPIRGGTDGSQLSFMGLPTPNIFTGGANFHGPYEYLVVDHLIQCIHTLIQISVEFSQIKK